jgi:hypothetical protein
MKVVYEDAPKRGKLRLLCNCRPYSEAARGGHLAVLQWVRANGCDWQRDHCLQLAPVRSETREWIQAQPDEGCGGDAHGGLVKHARHARRVVWQEQRISVTLLQGRLAAAAREMPMMTCNECIKNV